MPIAESFAVIVALLGQFRSERGEHEQADFNSFLEWLVSKNHEEIKNLLMLNAKATIGIKSLLKQDRDLVLDSLKRIDSAIASFASSLEGFNQLVEGVSPNSILSSQAVSILKQFDVAGASRAIVYGSMEGNFYQFYDGTSEAIELEDPRFADDDFQTLTELGLLRMDSNISGTVMYLYTRRAAALVSGRDA